LKESRIKIRNEEQIVNDEIMEKIEIMSKEGNWQH
jgi:hypothetical protein